MYRSIPLGNWIPLAEACHEGGGFGRARPTAVWDFPPPRRCSTRGGRWIVLLLLADQGDNDPATNIKPCLSLLHHSPAICLKKAWPPMIVFLVLSSLSYPGDRPGNAQGNTEVNQKRPIECQHRGTERSRKPPRTRAAPGGPYAIAAPPIGDPAGRRRR
eukprot:gene15153-biopygen13490